MTQKRILVADDNEQSLYFLQMLLQGNGYEAICVPNGAEALQTARQRPPDLIISDILMPVMDGFSLCREWKKDGKLSAIPFIFYTATYTDDRDREFALSLGSDDFLVKPVEPEVLLMLVQKMLNSAGPALDAQATTKKCARVNMPEAISEEAESIFLKQYNESLIRKLESKTEQLEYANRRLELDIAERRKAENALKESTEYLNQIINRIGDPIFVKDRQHRYLLVNDALCAFTGLKRKDLIGQATDGQLDKTIWEEEERVLETGGESVSEETVHDRLGNVRKVLSKKTLLTDRSGNRQVVGVLRDITEFKRLQSQFIQSQKMEAMGVLAGGIAHDFNNLLTVIRGYTEMLMEDVDREDARLKDFEQIMKAGQQATSLIEQLLAFSRKQVMQPKLLSLNDILDGIGKMLRRVIGEDIQFGVIMKSDLGMILADPGQIQQILMNLAVNARDAMPQGGTLTIETANVHLDESYQFDHPMVKSGAYVMLAISDSGVGMDPITLARIFEPFFTTKEKGKGTGLGLSTVYGIVKQSNGFIWVYSEPGTGTTFKIYFPRVENPEIREMDASESESRFCGEETILVVEDEAPVRDLATRILTERGYRVIKAVDGADALSKSRNFEGKIHLIISDVVMPGMSGKELVSCLEKERPGIRSLYVSGYTDDAIVQHGILDAAVAFLQKPFSVDGLVRKAWEVLHS